MAARAKRPQTSPHFANDTARIAIQLDDLANLLELVRSGLNASSDLDVVAASLRSVQASREGLAAQLLALANHQRGKRDGG
jgi:hypothetical protein